jgi:uncharacterized membrane protein YesL
MRPKVSVAWPALKEAAIGVYEHLGLAMLFSPLWLLLGLFPLVFVSLPLLEMEKLFPLRFLFPLLVGAFLFMPATCSIFEVCRLILAKEDVNFLTFFRAFGASYKRALQVGLWNGFLFLVLAADLFFAFHSGKRFFQFMGGIWVWFGAFLLVMNVYLPVLVAEGNTVKNAFKKAALLVLDNLGSSLLLLAETALLLLLSIAVPPLLLLFFPAMIGFLYLRAYQIIMTKYEDDPDAA